jgi:AcrR family transcriptional regulator
MSSMGRRRQHDEDTATSLLDAAEELIAKKGPEALSLREVAQAAGTTTRAVYTLFGSKDALLGALGVRAFDLLGQEVEALPTTARPEDDIVEAALVFRRFAIEHPALYSVAFQRTDPAVWPRFRPAVGEALAVLHKRFEPLAATGRLGDRTVREAALQFHALCEGLAPVELRGTPLGRDAEAFWRSAFQALIAGFAAVSA